MNSNPNRRCGGRGRWIKFPFLIAAVILLKSALVMWLWNALVPDLFHGPDLTYLQAIGLSVLAKLLVGFGGRPGWGRHAHHGPGRFRRSWRHLSKEEREKLRRRFCSDTPETENETKSEEN